MAGMIETWRDYVTDTPIEWHEIDYSWYLPEDTVCRPTEWQALNNLQFAADMLNRTKGAVLFSDEEWAIYLKDIELRLRWTNANVTPDMICAELHGYTVEWVGSTLNRISMIMLLRERLYLPPLPPIPAQYKRTYSRIEKKRKVA